MKVRGQRECKRCGTQWSYYETGSVTCPCCGSLRSVGLDERTEHTAGPVEFDLTPVRGAIDEEPVGRLAGRAADLADEYVRESGFVHAGSLRPLDSEFVAALELKHVGRDLSHRMRIDDDEKRYVLDLLAGADEGDRPTPAEVPDSLASARGLAAAAAIEAYHREITRLHDDLDPAVRNVLGRLRDHRKRIEALDGDVPSRESERFLDAIRDVGRYLVEGDETALVTAESRLDEAI